MTEPIKERHRRARRSPALLRKATSTLSGDKILAELDQLLADLAGSQWRLRDDEPWRSLHYFLRDRRQ